MAAHNDGLARASPESVGMDSAFIDAFLKDLVENSIEVHTLMLYRAGSVIAEGSWWPYRADRPHMMHSATKSFLAVAVGLAIEEGYFQLDTKVVDIFPQQAAAASDGLAISDNLAALTVEDLLTQTSGHAHGVSGGEWRGIKTGWLTEFFRLLLVHKPGTEFVYTSATSFMLSAINSQTTGTTVREFLEPRFCRPLGIKLLSWDVGPDGICPGGNGISCLQSDLSEVGHPALAKGQVKGHADAARVLGIGIDDGETRELVRVPLVDRHRKARLLCERHVWTAVLCLSRTRHRVGDDGGRYGRCRAPSTSRLATLSKGLWELVEAF
jgi:CubicO group peptidase (beta-lactamase class C family)